MKQGLQRAVPVASERFHDALDELENEVRLAQTVLRRDLAVLKQDRKKREAAAKQHEADRVRMATESRLNVPAKPEAAAAAAAIKPEATTPAAQLDAPLPPPPQPSKLHQKVDLPKAPPKVEDAPAQPPAIDTATAPPADPLFDATPTDSNHQEQEFDFDFEFGDAMDTGSNNNNESADMMDTSGDLDFTLDEGPSLLRGLEDFANAKSIDHDSNAAGANSDLDFNMPDLPDLNADAKPLTEQSKPAESVQQGPKQPDSTKDSKAVEEAADSKPAVNTNDSNNIDEPMETMTTDNLEDLFNLDDYDNAEGGDSAFNDAFFNFD